MTPKENAENALRLAADALDEAGDPRAEEARAWANSPPPPFVELLATPQTCAKCLAVVSWVLHEDGCFYLGGCQHVNSLKVRRQHLLRRVPAEPS